MKLSEVRPVHANEYKYIAYTALLYIKGVKAFVHVASDVSLRPDPNLVIPTVVKLVQSALTSAAKEPGLQAFVLTSSSTAASAVKPNTPFHISTESWNEEEIAKAWAPGP